MLQTVFDFGTLDFARLGVSLEWIGYGLVLLGCAILGVFLKFFRPRINDALLPCIVIIALGIAAVVLLEDVRLPLRIYGYGLMMVMGFICGIALARWRARRAGEDPDVQTQCGVVALVSGVLGARLAFVIERWDAHFPDRENILGDILNITSGGLIYYGGVLLAAAAVLIYLRAKRVPIRRHLDILAVSLMIGLAFGRAGCLLNGCCWGGPCREDWPLGMSFPMYAEPLVVVGDRAGPFSPHTDSPSPVYDEQLNERARLLHAQGKRDSIAVAQAGKIPGAVSPDPRLVQLIGSSETEVTADGKETRVSRLRLHPPRDLHGALTTNQIEPMLMDPDQVRAAFQRAAGDDGWLSEDEWRTAQRKGDGLLRGSESWADASTLAGPGRRTLALQDVQEYLARRRAWLIRAFAEGDVFAFNDEARADANAYLQEDLFAIAGASHSLPVKPAQALGIINALVLAGMLTLFYRHRRREGQVFALLMILYPITRFVLELVRDDNPHHLLKLVLTHNQYTSLALTVAGVGVMVLVHLLPASAGSALADRLARETDKRKAKP